MNTQSGDLRLPTKTKWFLALPCLAALVFHAWLRYDPGAGFKDSLIAPFLLLFLLQASGIPASFAAALKYRKERFILVVLGLGYLLMTLYSFLYTLGGAVSTMM